MTALKLVSNNLFRRKGRFVFTLLGISIGMAAFVALLSLGGSMRSEIERQAGALGGSFLIVPENICVFNQMAIISGNSISESLPFEMYERISAIEGLDVVPYLTQRAVLDDNPNVVLVGILPGETFRFRNWEIADGSFFSSDDENYVVMGQGAARRRGKNVGDEIVIRGETFRVKGILTETKSNDDEATFIPLNVVWRIFDKENMFSYMAAKIENMEDMERYKAAILNAANVQVATNDQIRDASLMIVNSVNITLRLVAAVSLFAAAFGIVNTMMTAISERRREIGILRAIGGRSVSIFKIFILESGLYGLLGGIAGVVAGFGASIFAAPIIASSQTAGDLLKGVTPAAEISITLVFTTISISIIIAVLSGLYPAWRASRLTPVEAISYE